MKTFEKYTLLFSFNPSQLICIIIIFSLSVLNSYLLKFNFPSCRSLFSNHQVFFQHVLALISFAYLTVHSSFSFILSFSVLSSLQIGDMCIISLLLISWNSHTACRAHEFTAQETQIRQADVQKKTDKLLTDTHCILSTLENLTDQTKSMYILYIYISAFSVCVSLAYLSWFTVIYITGCAGFCAVCWCTSRHDEAECKRTLEWF